MTVQICLAAPADPASAALINFTTPTTNDDDAAKFYEL
jgi:hypothetical protein